MRSGLVPVLSRPRLAFSDHSKLAVNIERVFGPSKIIVVVRHPLRWIESLYLHRLKMDTINIKEQRKNNFPGLGAITS